MAQIVTRVSLNTANIPFVSTFGGRTVMVGQTDQQNSGVNPVPGETQDSGVPHIFYCHNVIPTSRGVQSVDFALKANAVSSSVPFDTAFVVRDENNNSAIYSPAAGNNYLLTGVNSPNWTKMTDIADAAGKLVTKAQINNRTLFFIENVGCYEIDIEAGTISSVTLTGLTVTDITGISAANNYLLAFDDTLIYWGSPNPGSETDFTPSLVTGASSALPQDLAGRIVIVVNIAGGFIVYTTKNMIAAAYSGNARFPWVFRLIPNSSGIAEAAHVTSESYSSFHYAWTTAGLMRVQPSSADNIFPEASDFLSSGMFEDYDDATDTLIQSYLDRELHIQMNYISSRYLVISYGVDPLSFSHCLVHDFGLKRWGKLRIQHIDCFEYAVPNFFGIQTYDQLSPRSYDDLAGLSYDELSSGQSIATPARDTVAFLQQDGKIQLMDVDLSAQGADAVIYFGKYQLIRSQVMDMFAFEVENVDSTANNFTAEILSSWNGKNFNRVRTAFLETLEPNLRKYLVNVSAQNHTLRFTGAFNFVSLQITSQRGGTR